MFCILLFSFCVRKQTTLWILPNANVRQPLFNILEDNFRFRNSKLPQMKKSCDILEILKFNLLKLAFFVLILESGFKCSFCYWFSSNILNLRGNTQLS